MSAEMTEKPQHATWQSWRQEWDEELLRDWNKPTSIQEFGRRFGIKPTSVSRAARRLGLWNPGGQSE